MNIQAPFDHSETRPFQPQEEAAAAPLSYIVTNEKGLVVFDYTAGEREMTLDVGEAYKFTFYAHAGLYAPHIGSIDDNDLRAISLQEK
ncbi:hypothetical protein ACSTLA_23270, partial [Vibrio parahaemolyticus]